jgi:protein-tyrosine phosphatase
MVRQLNPVGRIWSRLWARSLEFISDLLARKINLSWVTEQLATGGALRKSEYRQLKQAGVTAVIDLREESMDDVETLRGLGIQFLHLPTTDAHAQSQEQLIRGTKWALEQINKGGKVFAHCQHGVGRGPLQATAILIGQGLTAPEALRTVRARRWQAAPNDRQIEALLAFEERWKSEQREAGQAAPLPEGSSRTADPSSAQPTTSEASA